MIAKVISIEKKQIKKGTHIGKDYYIHVAVVGKLRDQQAIKIVIVPRYEDALISKMVVEEEELLLAAYNAAKAAGQPYNGEIINVKKFIVGDLTLNPNGRPLPAYNVKKSDGTWSDVVHNSMSVYIELDEDGTPKESPEAKALRIIDSICRRVEVSSAAPTLDAPDPLAGG